MGFKKILRDIPSSILLVISISLIVFLGITSLDIINNIFVMNNSSGIGRYNYCYDINIDYNLDANKCIDRDTLNVFLDLIEDDIEHCSIITEASINDTSVYSDVELFLTENVNEEIYNLTGKKYKLDDENVILISQNMLEFVENGYIKIGKDRYKVIDSLKCDGEVCFIFEDNMSKESINNIRDLIYHNTECINFIVHNEEMVNWSNSDKLIEELNNKGIIYEIYDISYGSYIQGEDLYTFFCELFLSITYIFIFINCLIVSNIWIERRKKDFAVKRIFGWSKISIVDYFVHEIIKLVGLGVIIGSFMSVIYMVVFKENLLEITNNVLNAAYMASIIFIGLILSLIKPIYYLLKKDPIEMLNER